MALPPGGGKIAEKKVEFKEIKEHKLEKFEKPEIKEKPEKFEKNEHKELKHEKIEIKEHKHEKIEIKEHSKAEIKDFKEFKEHGEKTIPKEKDGKELVENPGDLFDPVRDLGLAKQHLADLEKSAAAMRHFIENAERPDLGKGALKNEKDKGGGG